MPLTACGTSGLGSVGSSDKSVHGVLGYSLLTAQGKTRKDQQAIDETIEAGIKTGIYHRSDIR